MTSSCYSSIKVLPINSRILHTFCKYKLCKNKEAEISKRANKEYLKDGKFKHRKLQY